MLFALFTNLSKVVDLNYKILCDRCYSILPFMFSASKISQQSFDFKKKLVSLYKEDVLLLYLQIWVIRPLWFLRRGKEV